MTLLQTSSRFLAGACCAGLLATGGILAVAEPNANAAVAATSALTIANLNVRRLKCFSTFSGMKTNFNYRSGTVTFAPNGDIVIVGVIDGGMTGYLTVKPGVAPKATYRIDDSPNNTMLISNLKIDRDKGTVTFNSLLVPSFKSELNLD